MVSEKLMLHRPRTKYFDVEKANLTYRKQRRRTKTQTRKITRRLLNLLGKILNEIRWIERENAGTNDLLTTRQARDMEIISTVSRTFNEGTRLPHSLKMRRRLFGVDAKKVGGDAGYAGNANRELCRKERIQTSFVKRGRSH